MSDLFKVNVMMLAPCLGKFGGIETFCLTLAEDLIVKGASVTLLRKKVAGFKDDGSIQKNEDEILSTWSESHRKRFDSHFVQRRDKFIKKAISKSDLVHLHNPMVEGVWWAKRTQALCHDHLQLATKRIASQTFVWRWAVSKADRRWYISEFVWDSWEKKRRANSARLPVVSKMPTGECPHENRKGFYLSEGLCRTKESEFYFMLINKFLLIQNYGH